MTKMLLRKKRRKNLIRSLNLFLKIGHLRRQQTEKLYEYKNRGKRRSVCKNVEQTYKKWKEVRVTISTKKSISEE
jgi:hypothetical protein